MKIIAGSIWFNNKNKREYQIVKEAIDCTNERDGLEVIVYICKEVPDKLFVREKSEFLSKFTLKK